jgi:CheY-like chemotaxis protein
MGHEVVTANDGAEGLRRAAAERPALIVLDLSLPELDGWEAARRLKADPALAAVPIVALTVHAMTGDRAKALAAGCYDYETKPIDFEQLRAKLDRLLAAAGAADA